MGQALFRCRPVIGHFIIIDLFDKSADNQVVKLHITKNIFQQVIKDLINPMRSKAKGLILNQSSLQSVAYFHLNGFGIFPYFIQ